MPHPTETPAASRDRRGAARGPGRRNRRIVRKPRGKKRIVILVHKNTGPDDWKNYFIAQLGVLWRWQGNSVRLMKGPHRRLQGDLLFMHVDLSVVPETYLAVASHYPVVVNARVRDIRKSAISRELVGPGSDWDGPVIVKTDLNCAGVPEERYKGRRGSGHPRMLRVSNDYPIFDHRRDVPAELADNPDLIVEKFLPEVADGHYCLRSYNFLGEAEDCFLVYSDRPVVNLASIRRMERVEVHPEIRSLREELGFDYGKFDYVVHDGRAILLDANKTPGTLPVKDRDTMIMLRRRAAGIYKFLR